ncbi:hypothetical protein MJM04_34225, partial [Salmonella enterica subsp. enterica serovar Cerro]|nr:hypothetical protein [Salmonella enterica subsp. enterica serovar Cerro]
LNRSLFTIGIDNTLPEEFNRLYPRLVRTTREALAGFEAEYGIAFDYLSKKVNTLLYLDADVVCKGSLQDLLQLDLTEKIAAVV